MVSSNKIPGKEAQLRELRGKMLADVKMRAGSLREEARSFFTESLVEGIIRGKATAREIVELVELLKERYASKKLVVALEVVRENADELDRIFAQAEEAPELPELAKAKLIFLERENYADSKVTWAAELLAERLKEVEKDADFPPREFGALLMLASPAKVDERPLLWDVVSMMMNSLGYEPTAKSLGEICAMIDEKKMDCGTKEGMMQIENTVLIYLIRNEIVRKDESTKEPPAEKGDGVPPVAMPAPAAPAAVSAYREKGFHINASHVQALMAAEGIIEKEARAYIGAIVYGYKLGSSKPAIGNVYFNTNAIQKNLRGVCEIKELGIRPLNAIKFLERKGVASVMKSGDTSSLNLRTTELEEPWKSLMVEIFRQHQKITGNRS